MNKVKNPFDIYHITGKIYLFLFEDMFDLSMHFLRYQEYYESPKFHGKPFTIIEFMEWYAKSFGQGAFTYPKDWMGFNIPSYAIWKVHANTITDYNKYDAAMLAAHNLVLSRTHLVKGSAKADDFYIVGVCKSAMSVLEHELAHGLYATNGEYRKEVNESATALPIALVKRMFEYLLKVGYTQHVLEDELHAYMATGLPPELSKDKELLKAALPFKHIYTKYTKDLKLNPFKLRTVKAAA